MGQNYDDEPNEAGSFYGFDDLTSLKQIRCAHGKCPCEHSFRCTIWLDYAMAYNSLRDAEKFTHGLIREVDDCNAAIQSLKSQVARLTDSIRSLCN